MMAARSLYRVSQVLSVEATGHVINNFKCDEMEKIMKLLVHPYVVMILFCALLISGEQMGGFYLFYIMLGLPHLVLHALLGLAGILALLIAGALPRTRTSNILNIAGICCMAASLIRFFTQPGASYNYQTFHLVLPMILLAVFAVLAALVLLFNLQQFIPKT